MHVFCCKCGNYDCCNRLHLDSKLQSLLLQILQEHLGPYIPIWWLYACAWRRFLGFSAFFARLYFFGYFCLFYGGSAGLNRTFTYDDQHIRSSYRIVIYDHHIWSSCMIIVYDHHIRSSYMIIIHDHHVWSSYMIIISSCPSGYHRHRFSMKGFCDWMVKEPPQDGRT